MRRPRPAQTPHTLATMTIDAVFFDVGEVLVDETREYGTWADWLGIPRHTFSAVFGAIGTLARAMTDRASGTVLACLYAADRYHHLATEIRPRLAAGHTVISDRYLASGLVMQRLDGLNPDYLHTINADADLPHLAIILTADPATVHGRLVGRRTHNRYQRRPDSSSSEVGYHANAADRLEQAGAPTLRLDTTGLSPALVADHVLNRIATVSDAAQTHTLEPQ